MLIANPIYDTFFKYLFEDNALAIKLLSAILNEKIISLAPRPQENTIYLPEQFLTVIRMDFAATIRTEDGSLKKVLIELQKSKATYDIMRFRKYLAENYSRDDAMSFMEGQPSSLPLPIITVYFLGFKLKGLTAPVIKVDRKYMDVFKGEEIKEKNDFIEKLTHDCYVISIPYLKAGLRTPLEKMLGLFNQDFVKAGNDQVLVLPAGWENDPELQDFIQRLGKPLLNEDLLRKAEAEENFENLFVKLERKLEQTAEKLGEVEEQIAKAEEQAAKAEEQIAKAEEQAAKVEQERVATLKIAINALRQAGKTIEDISNLLGINIDTIENLIK